MNNLYPIVRDAMAYSAIAFTIGFLIYVVVKEYTQARNNRLLRRDGRAIKGTIRNKETGLITKPILIYRYFIHYDFVLDGKIISGRQEASELILEDLQIGDSVNIMYLPKNPRVSRLASRYRKAKLHGL